MVLNAACDNRPRDLYGYLSTELWAGCCPAAIERVRPPPSWSYISSLNPHRRLQWTAREVVGSDGSSAVRVEVSAHFRGQCQTRGCATVPLSHPPPPPSQKGEEGEESFGGVDFGSFCEGLSKSTAEMKLADFEKLEGMLAETVIDGLEAPLVGFTLVSASLGGCVLTRCGPHIE